MSDQNSIAVVPTPTPSAVPPPADSPDPAQRPRWTANCRRALFPLLDRLFGTQRPTDADVDRLFDSQTVATRKAIKGLIRWFDHEQNLQCEADSKKE